MFRVESKCLDHGNVADHRIPNQFTEHRITNQFTDHTNFLDVRNSTYSMDNLYVDFIDLLRYLKCHCLLGETKTPTKSLFISVQISLCFLVRMYRHGSDHHDNSCDSVYPGIMLPSSLCGDIVDECALGLDAMLPTLSTLLFFLKKPGQ